MTEFPADKPVSASEVRLAAMNLLARREHTRDELARKLARRFPDRDVVTAVIDELGAENLQSDGRFAESFVRQRFNRGQGPIRIVQEMRQKGIPEADIQAALTAGEFDWCASARDVMLRKFGDDRPADLKEKARRLRFMQYRGFESEHYRDLT